MVKWREWTPFSAHVSIMLRAFSKCAKASQTTRIFTRGNVPAFSLMNWLRRKPIISGSGRFPIPIIPFLSRTLLNECISLASKPSIFITKINWIFYYTLLLYFKDTAGFRKKHSRHFIKRCVHKSEEMRRVLIPIWIFCKKTKSR